MAKGATLNQQSDPRGEELYIPKDAQKLRESRAMVAAGVDDPGTDYLAYLRDLGYVIELHGPDNLKEHILATLPHVLLLDLDELGERAAAITKSLKENPLTYTMPIIIALGRRNLKREIEILEAGAEDFIVKPIVPQVLAARVYTSFRRNIRLQISNPLTGLPGATYIEEQTKKRLEKMDPVAMCYVDLVDFKAFNDRYSYNRGDVVIRLLANILNEGVSMCCGENDFVGHIGGDDFVIITKPEHVGKVCEYVISSFDTLIPLQYDEKDMEREYFISVNRQGEKMRFPIMSVVIGVSLNSTRSITAYLEMTEVAAEMKEYAKSIAKSESGRRKSVYRVDKRSL